jgi:Flp pilus assembly protein TadG
MRTRERRGSVVVLVAVLMVVLLGFGAFAVDVSQMQAYKSELRRTADAASLAATLHLLSDPARADSVAALYVLRNPVMGDVAEVVAYSYGTYNGTLFTPLPPALATTANAFRVSLRSSGDFYLAQFIGGTDFEVSATATAWLPVSTTPCAKPWALRRADLDAQLPGWPTASPASLRNLSDTVSAKVFMLKSNNPAFAGVVNLPAYHDASTGATYPGSYSAATYAQSISSGCHPLNIGDRLQTKIGPYDPETVSGILGTLPGQTPVCALPLSPWCWNGGGQMGVAMRIPVIEDVTDFSSACATDARDANDVYTTPAPNHVLCGDVVDLVTFVLTRAVFAGGETFIYGSYAGRDSIGPVNGYAQRPILVQ